MPTDKEIAKCYQQLADHLQSEHGLILIESELDEIIRLAQITVANYDSLVVDGNEQVLPCRWGFKIT